MKGRLLKWVVAAGIIIISVIAVIASLANPGPDQNSGIEVGALEDIEDTILFPTDTEEVKMKNFYRLPKQRLQYEDQIIPLAQTERYFIYFNFEGSYFAIELQPPLLSADRTAAENAFLSLLDISKDEACILPVNVTLMDESALNSVKSVDYGLSFCPGAFPSS